MASDMGVSENTHKSAPVKNIYNNIIKGNNKTIMSHHSLEFVLVFIFSIKMSLYLCLNVNE